MLIRRILQRFPLGRGADLPLGVRGERAAENHLKTLGHRILARNLRSKLGEIDLLTEDRQTREIVLVEVKAAATEDPPPEVHVNQAKQHKLTQLAGLLVRQRRLEHRAIRFDVVGVVWPEGAAKPTRLTHHPAAFEATF